MRTLFSKNGGNLGSTGSVAFQFRRMGVFRLNPEGIDHDDLELYLIDQEALEKRSITPMSAAHEYICTAPVELPEAMANEALAMIDKLEQDDDVQNVYHSLI